MTKNQFVLTMQMVAIDHPYPNDPTVSFEVWAAIRVFVSQDASTANLVHFEWNIDTFAEWYLKNAARVLTIMLPDPRLGESLAERIYRLVIESTPENIEEMLDLQWKFMSACCIKHWFPGCYLPAVVVGLNDGAGEISFEEDDAEVEHRSSHINTSKYRTLINTWRPGVWAYQVDLRQFFTQTKWNLIDVMQNWLGNHQTSAGYVRIAGLVQALKLYPNFV